MRCQTKRAPITVTWPLVVQQSFPEPRPTTNPYLVMLRDSLGATDGLQIRVFSWRSALFRPYDVFHVHWPELLLKGSSRTRSAARQLLTLMLLLRLRRKRIPIVRTLHNLQRPDGLSRGQRFIFDVLERQTALVILLNDTGASEGHRPTRTIIHGHYRDWFAPYEKSSSTSGQLSYFGLLRPYKGVDRLLDAFRSTQGDLRLRIAGSANPTSLGQLLADMAQHDSRVSLTLDYLTDQELVEVVSHSELVVLPYRELHNSGSVLAALSLDRPVLVPKNQVTEQLGREVGEGWVHTYAGELTAGHLQQALESVHSRPAGGHPDLRQRDWDPVGRKHLAAYRSAVELLR